LEAADLGRVDFAIKFLVSQYEARARKNRPEARLQA